MLKSNVALIPARSGSSRVAGKNTRLLLGHPMIAYTITSALESGFFDEVIVATDDLRTSEIAKHYGITEVFIRSSANSGTHSLDIEWLTEIWGSKQLNFDFFTILRPTSPLRSLDLIQRGLELFEFSNADSLRTINKVKEHPGKMWVRGESYRIIPFLPQPVLDHATHAMQYQSLQELFVQNSVLEIARTSVIPDTASREGKSVIGLETFGIENYAVDTQDDWLALIHLVETSPNLLIKINRKSFNESSKL